MRDGKASVWITIAIPAAFVLLWSTGWIVARFAAEDSEPLTFLLLRYAGAGGCLLVFALLSGAPWPATRSGWRHAIVSGLLLHGFYLGGIWWAVAHGVPASISALLAALQPILSAMLAPRLLGERLTARQWTGVLAGFSGLILVLAPKLASTDLSNLGAVAGPLFVNVLGMISVTLGTFYQKRYLHDGDLRSIACLQYAGAFAITLPLAFAFENLRVDFTLNTTLSLLWSVVALSIVSILLLLRLIQRGEVSRAAQLIYLVPPIAAVQAFAFFGERLSPLQLVGMAVTCLGVALAVRR